MFKTLSMIGLICIEDCSTREEYRELLMNKLSDCDEDALKSNVNINNEYYVWNRFSI